MQVWYLSGWAAHLHSDGAVAAEALATARALFVRNECEEGDVLLHIDELLALHPPAPEPGPA